MFNFSNIKEQKKVLETYLNEHQCHDSTEAATQIQQEIKEV